MRSYEAARGYFSFLSFLAWSCIVLGGLVALLGVSAAVEASRFGAGGLAAVFAAMPGLALFGVGFFFLVYIQTARATVDSAEYAQQALKVSRDQLSISQQLLKLAEGREAAATYGTAPQLKNVTMTRTEFLRPRRSRHRHRPLRSVRHQRKLGMSLCSREPRRQAA